MRQAWRALGWVAFVCAGCEEAPSSHLEPSAPIDTLSSEAAAQLCRFTVDLLGDADFVCTGAEAPPPLVDFEACRAAPPFDGFRDVEAWEECVNARDADPCAIGELCTP